MRQVQVWSPGKRVLRRLLLVQTQVRMIAVMKSQKLDQVEINIQELKWKAKMNFDFDVF